MQRDVAGYLYGGTSDDGRVSITSVCQLCHLLHGVPELGDDPLHGGGSETGAARHARLDGGEEAETALTVGRSTPSDRTTRGVLNVSRYSQTGPIKDRTQPHNPPGLLPSVGFTLAPSHTHTDLGSSPHTSVAKFKNLRGKAPPMGKIVTSSNQK